MMIRLEVPEGPHGTPVPHTYHQKRVRLGTGETNDITLAGEGVTRYHAVIELKDGQGVLLPGMDGGDLRVNGTPVAQHTLLQPGDRLGIGSLEIGYKLVPFPKPVVHRRTSWLEWSTVALLISGVLGQVLFLLLPSRSLRQEIRPDLLEPTPTPLPQPTPLPVTATPTPEPTPVPLLQPPEDPQPEPTPDAGPAPETGGPSVDGLFAEAEELLRDGKLLDAERKLRETLRQDPSFLPAKVALARLLGEQSKFEESLRIWQQVRREAPAGSLEAMDARLEIPSLQRKLERVEQEPEALRIREIDQIAVPTPPPLRPAFPTPDVPLVQQASPVGVVNLQMERYAESPRYDEFRMLNFELAHQPGTPAVAPGSIQVRVTFFEQAGTRVRKAAIPNPSVVLNIPRGLSRNQRIPDLSAAYEVPKGAAADGRSYYGAVVEVFVDGQEVERAADPGFLLDFLQ